jgi:formylglycine-generating enzyme required for sulfatase activity
MAPEQAAGKTREIGPAVDVYALGAILYELLTGRPPFLGETSFDTVAQVLSQDPVPPRILKPKVPRDLEIICLKCLQKEPQKRYATSEALAEDLRRFQEGQPIWARPVSRTERLFKWARRHPSTALLVVGGVLVLLSLAAGGVWFRQRTRQERAAALVRELTSAETAAVPRLVEELADYSSWANPLLREKLLAAPENSGPWLRVRLALLPDDPGQVPALLRYLPQARPEEVRVLRDALQPYRDQVTGSLWELLSDPRAEGKQRLRSACALAAYDPDNPRWLEVSAPVVTQMLSDNQLLVSYWADALQPVRKVLIPALTTVSRDPERRETERSLAINVLADYARDQPEELTELLLEAPVETYAVPLSRLQAHRDAAVPLLQRELTRTLAPEWRDAALSPTWQTPDRTLVETLESAQGILAERFAMCQTLPLQQLDALNERLRTCGYRPVQLRPYSAGRAVQVAAIWTRDGQAVRLVHGASAEEVRRLDAAARGQGLQPLDVTGYHVPDLSSTPNVRYAALWGPRTTGVEEVCVYVGVSDDEREAVRQPLSTKGFLPRTQTQLTVNGHTYHSGIWWKPTNLPEDFDYPREENYWSESGYAATLRPDCLHTDVVVFPTPLVGQDHRTPAPSYTAFWQRDAEWESREAHGVDPGEQVKRGHELAAESYRPVALSLAENCGQPLISASVWHRPLIPEAVRDALAKRQANAAVALLHLAVPEAVWPLLRHRPDPSPRSYLVDRLAPLRVDPHTVLARLEIEPDVSARRVLPLALSGFDEQQIPSSTRQPLAARLLEQYRRDPDPGIHGALDWLLRQRWAQAEALAKIDAELQGQPQGERGWYVNGQGQTFSLVAGPVEFTMGTPPAEMLRENDEIPHRQRIGRSFALATKEVTVEQYLRFRADSRYNYKYSPTPNCPMNSLTWYEAAQYCRWLSELEHVAPDQMCYPEIDQIGPGMELPPNCLERTGYRLPTEAEFEYACRAEAASARFYGLTDELLDRYAYYEKNSRNRTWPVGRLKPNDLGLFDLLGNVEEWCQDAWAPYQIEANGSPSLDKEQLGPLANDVYRNMRGGYFGDHSINLRSGRRSANLPYLREGALGFRLARTHRSSD